MEWIILSIIIIYGCIFFVTEDSALPISPKPKGWTECGTNMFHSDMTQSNWSISQLYVTFSSTLYCSLSYKLMHPPFPFMLK